MRPKNLRYPNSWDQRSPQIHDGVLFIPETYSSHYLWERTPFFINEQPLKMEICSGNGEWIISKALNNPQINWIAVDIRFDRVQKIWSKMKNYGLQNLFIICGDAQLAVKYYIPLDSIQSIFINFPDPWPKNKHAKNRLLQKQFFNNLIHTAKPDCSLTIVSDHKDYIEQIKNELGHSIVWKSPIVTNSNEGYGASYFERLWRDLGKEIYYLSSHKNQENPTRISFNCSETSLMRWDKEVSRLQELSQSKAPFCIEIDLHLTLSPYKLLNEATYQSHFFAIETLAQKLSEIDLTNLRYIQIFNGPLDFVDLYYKSEAEFEDFKVWAKDVYENIDIFSTIVNVKYSSFSELKLESLKKTSYGRQVLRLHCVQILSGLLHRLSSQFPETVKVFANFDYQYANKEVFRKQLLSKEIFPHIETSLHMDESPNIGIVLPFDERITPTLVKTLERLLQEIKAVVIPERIITECWHGIDFLIIEPNALSAMGLRQLQGFCAAGGVVVNISNYSLNLSEEISLEEFQEIKNRRITV